MAATLIAAFATLVGHHLGALSVFFQEADGHCYIQKIYHISSGGNLTHSDTTASISHSMLAYLVSAEVKLLEA